MGRERGTEQTSKLQSPMYRPISPFGDCPPSVTTSRRLRCIMHIFVRDVRSRLTGQDAGPFVMDGEEWFPLPGASRLSWPAVLEAVDDEQRRLHQAVAALSRDSGGVRTQAERFDLVLGITCHAVYHAGQVQLIKKLRGV